MLSHCVLYLLNGDEHFEEAITGKAFEVLLIYY